MYIDKVIDLFNKKDFSSKILEKFHECISDKEFKKYEKTRNREYHCIRTTYVIDSQYIGALICNNICNMEYLMRNLYELFSIIIDEEEIIYKKIILTKEKANK